MVENYTFELYIRSCMGTNMHHCAKLIIKIGQAVAEIGLGLWRFNGFQNDGRPPSEFFKILTF